MRFVYGLLLAGLMIVPAQAQVISPLTGTTADVPSATSPGQPAAAAPARKKRRSLPEQFKESNTTNDGKLTLEQATAGRMTTVVRDFEAIDKQHRGYVTLAEIQAYRKASRKARAK